MDTIKRKRRKPALTYTPLTSYATNHEADVMLTRLLIEKASLWRMLAKD